MKAFKSIGLLTILFSLAVFTWSCGGTEAHGEGKEYTSAYVCPMHCEGSGSEAEGTCPVCSMDYVAQADHTGDGHGH